MTYSYNKLWIILIDRNMKKKDLMAQTGITGTTIAKMGRDESVPLETLEKICRILNCSIGDIVDYTTDKEVD